jgi:carbonic anhydrase
MSTLDSLLQRNQIWAEAIRRQDPEFFLKLSGQQAPEYLWIGCSDSRVPANQIVGLMPGELFVHRNVANLVVHTDFNCLAVMQFAVDLLRVKHVIVCGHYGCSGVQAALRRDRLGLSDNWLRHVQDVHHKHRDLIGEFSPDDSHAKLCELNVIEQVQNVSHTTILRDAWKAGQDVSVHGWIYGLHNGLIKDLQITMEADTDPSERYEQALQAVRTRK